MTGAKSEPRAWQRMLSGRRLDLLNPSPLDIELSDIARTLSVYVDKFDLDPEQLAALEQRISLFETLKRKYGGSIADVIAFGERAAERMQKIEGRDAELERLAKEIEKVRAQMNRAGEALRKSRLKVAPKLSEKIRQNLRDLGFRQSPVPPHEAEHEPLVLLAHARLIRAADVRQREPVARAVIGVGRHAGSGLLSRLPGAAGREPSRNNKS